MLTYRILLPEQPGAGDLCTLVYIVDKQLLPIYKRCVTELNIFGIMILRICAAENLRRQNHITERLLKALETVYDALLFKYLRMCLS